MQSQLKSGTRIGDNVVTVTWGDSGCGWISLFKPSVPLAGFLSSLNSIIIRDTQLRVTPLESIESAKIMKWCSISLFWGSKSLVSGL